MIREEIKKRDLKEDSFSQSQEGDQLLVFRGPDGVMYAVSELTETQDSNSKEEKDQALDEILKKIKF